MSTTGKWRAIEITLAADEDEIRTREQLSWVCREVERRIQECGSDRGAYTLSGVISDQIQPRDIDIDALIASAMAAGEVGQAPSRRDADIELRMYRADAPLRVYPLFSSAAFMEGPDNAERLLASVERKQRTLERAAAAGYETHLVLLQWALGSTEHWRRILAESPLATTQPEFLWTIDFFPEPPTLTRLVPPV